MIEPLRFLHIADAALDVPLGDLTSLSEDLQSLAEDATLLAFDQAIQEAVARKVDFVLLTGSTFREDHQSLRARLGLISGLEELDELGISVFVLPGSLDPEPAWRDIPNLPANVTLLAMDEESETPVAVLRAGRVIATISAIGFSRTNPIPNSEGIDAKTSKSDSTRSTPFRIGLLAEWPETTLSVNTDKQELGRLLSMLDCDYLAVPLFEQRARPRSGDLEAGQTIATKHGIAHHPGRLQALSERETGPHGASLIEVDKQGQIRRTFLPLAAIRRLRLEVPVPPHGAVEDIAQAMLSQLIGEKPLANEQAWFITWVLKGSGAGLESLKARPLQTDLLDLLPQKTAGDQRVSLHHQLRVQEIQGPIGDDDSLGELERLYRQTLDATLATGLGLFQTLANRVLSGLGDLGPENWQDRLADLVREVDPGDVSIRAHALGREWFAERQES
jgi:hypothetical protein